MHVCVWPVACAHTRFVACYSTPPPLGALDLRDSLRTPEYIIIRLYVPL